MVSDCSPCTSRGARVLALSLDTFQLENLRRQLPRCGLELGRTGYLLDSAHLYRTRGALGSDDAAPQRKAALQHLDFLYLNWIHGGGPNGPSWRIRQAVSDRPQGQCADFHPDCGLG